MTDPTAKALQVIPGIEPSISRDLVRIGITRVEELVGRDPEERFDQSNAEAGVVQDRCLLSTFRCAVYFAEGGRDPDLLRWWNWKDRQRSPSPRASHPSDDARG